MKNFTFLFFCFLTANISLAQNAPVDYETDGFGSDWTWTVFENVDNPALEIIANPDPTGLNPSATVAKFTARAEGAPFAGCETMHGSDIGTFTITEDNSTIRIMVWKSVISDVGIKLVRFDNWSLGEIKVANTLINEWEQITFDFSSHIDLQYDQLVVFPDFADRTEDHIIYFDNIFGAEAVPTSIDQKKDLQFTFYPNPCTNVLNLETTEIADEIQLFNMMGEQILKLAPSGNKNNIDVSELSSGIYFISTITGDKTYTKRFVKE